MFGVCAKAMNVRRPASLAPPKLPTNRLVEYSVPERALFLRYNYL